MKSKAMKRIGNIYDKVTSLKNLREADRKKSGEKRIVFTGSTVLMDQIGRVPENKFPFVTTIKGDNDYYEFT